MRSDLTKYLTEGKTGIDQLFAEYRNSLDETFHFRLYAGILEMMYGGLGAEFLVDPYANRFAWGFTVNALRQEDSKNFDFKDYKTLTLYLSTYYASPFYNLDFSVHLGKYLARDYGGTFEVRRTFENGYSVGGFFTKTNLPAELYGEGSFDKGLFLGFLLMGCFQEILRMLTRR